MPVRTKIINRIAHASIKNSDVFEVNNMVVAGRNDSVFRAGASLTFEFIGRDKVNLIFNIFLVRKLKRPRLH
jgi:hypothetical protein